MQSPYLPREKVLASGPRALRDVELWACVLGHGQRGHSVWALASKIVRQQSAFRGEVSRCLFAELGPAQFARVQAVWEIARRWREAPAPQLRSVRDALLLAQDLRTRRQEVVKIWYCSSVGEIVHEAVVALGSQNMAVISPGEIFSALRTAPFDSLLVAHNHPSGSIAPSDADLVFTARLEAACQIMGCWLRDHVIIARKGHYSFREQGKLTAPP